MPAAVAVVAARRQAGDWLRGFAAVALVLALGTGAGCLEQRQEQCRVFAATADACYVNAGLDRFFQENVDCDRPVSTLEEYRCLVKQYEAADCSSQLAAYTAVDDASLECLGWDEGLADQLADDDDSAR